MTKDELLKLVTVLQAELDATNRQVEILSDALAESRREIARLKAVQEPVAFVHNETGLLRQANRAKGGDFEPRHWTPLYTTPTAQPAVPDAMTSADIQEHIEYVAGWNECRQAMLEMMK
jgi:hypothetical protein